MAGGTAPAPDIPCEQGARSGWPQGSCAGSMGAFGLSAPSVGCFACYPIKGW